MAGRGADGGSIRQLQGKKKIEGRKLEAESKDLLK